ncbi:MAG: exostosin family protein [Patescibacteria group bacterium]|nr:exostosin family protein [Patescibacteria group bacterium]
MKTKLFIADAMPGAPLVSLIRIQKGQHDTGQTLFTNTLPRTFALTSYEFVPTIADADYALFPHAIRSKKDSLLPAVRKAREEARAAGKQIIVFVGGDLSHDIFIDDVIVLKGSQYRLLKRPNEIIVLPPAEDFADSMAIAPRAKSEKPVISFCGWAGFATPLSYAKYALKNAWIDVNALATRAPRLRVFKKGLYWRRKAMRVLARDRRIETRFIVRKTFSANAKTISLDPIVARREYIENMRESDLVLAPKGDGNFSVRFYEALSMGRIPIVIDTDMVFPLEDLIRYDDFILRVPYTDIDLLADIVVDFYATVSEEKFIAMQKAARAAYERYLRYDAFFNTLFPRLNPKR